MPTDEYGKYGCGRYLDDTNMKVNYKDLFGHAKELALISARAKRPSIDYPLLRVLYEALEKAEVFVHFTTYGISHNMIGALKLISLRVPVRGIVSNVDSNTLDELIKHKAEAPGFDVKAYGTESSWRDMPHQKLIVIDGLMAFKGAANLTLNAWRKATIGKDMVEVVTDVKEVIQIHNRYFSPIWAELSTVGGQIEMSTVPF